MNAHPEPGRVRVREATVADLATLLEFRLAMMEDIAGASVARSGEMRGANEAWLDEHFGRDFIALVAELDERPVASAGLLWFRHPPGPKNPTGVEAYILNVYTKPEARRMGAARLLMERLIDKARLAGAGRVWLRASDQGRPLYESIGFGASNYLQLKREASEPADGDKA